MTFIVINFIRTHHFFSSKAALLNFHRSETDPDFSAVFGCRESRKLSNVFH